MIVIFTLPCAYARIVVISMDTNPSWTAQTGNGYSLVSSGTAFFAIAGPTAVATGRMALVQSSDDSFFFIASNDSQRFISRMPDLRLNGFFPSAINFFAKPTATQVIFYINGLVADISQYNRIDVIAHVAGTGILLKDALTNR